MKIKKLLSTVVALSMLPVISLPAFSAEPITADEVRDMLFAENITTVPDCDELQETVYYNKQNRPCGAIKHYIHPEQAIRIHEENSDGSVNHSRAWLVKSSTTWDGWYYLFINEGDYEHMNFNPVDSSAQDGTSEAYFYLEFINDIADFEKIADILKEVNGITSIQLVKYNQLETVYEDIVVNFTTVNAFKIESADGTKYIPLQSVEDPYAVITDNEIKILNAWTVYDASYMTGFLNDIQSHKQNVTEHIYEDLSADYPFSDAPIEDTDTLSKYIGTPCAFSDIPETGDDAYTKEEIASVNALADLGFMQGYEDKTFRPQNTVTRAEAAIMAYKLLGLDENSPRENELTDISGHWAEEAIGAVAAAGIINGYEDKSFRPDEQIEYRHFFKIMLGVLIGFNVSVYEEHDIIGTAMSRGLTRNLGTFITTNKMPRIHAAVVAANVLDSHIYTSKVTFYQVGLEDGFNSIGVSLENDITLIDYLNGKKLHGLDLRLSYNYARVDELRSSYNEKIRSMYEEYLNKAGSSETV
ncbi:MAG TPA: S-layer homology domain-containing protein [Candidatus Ornithomonoglobus intestinigallinarum]|uniref:S-layer homology domain-containing protein n=1 Tax=Candidatus Ornithomonoglobus intestinigallinarum TaxID=2840894 RepID=A0A9D1H0Y9_9FIRM|nr:S-layer homology domain-containing protein [Candidatus Ornithomonoglobus intestinigallinarum]